MWVWSPGNAALPAANRLSHPFAGLHSLSRAWSSLTAVAVYGGHLGNGHGDVAFVAENPLEGFPLVCEVELGSVVSQEFSFSACPP